MMIASAIKYYIDETDSEVILCGRRHGDVIKQLPILGFKPQQGYKELAQGFVDDSGEFLTREEAYEHAVNCSQISPKDSKELFSEDLW